jgi:hypothetical protein
VERCQTLIQSQFNIQSCATLPCIAKLKWITQYQLASHVLILRTVWNAEL